MARTMGAGTHFILVLCLMLTAACTTTPDAEELPDNEKLVQEEPVHSAQEASPPAAGTKEPSWPVRRLKIKGVRGARITFEATGTPEFIAKALLDFEGDAGHRSWVKSFAPLPPLGKLQRARWDFEGKAGINPTVEVGFKVEGTGEKMRIRYRLTKKDFGLGAFFGDYLIELKSLNPPRSTIRERTFIDSGVWIANASFEEIEDGLKEDARLLIPWLEERWQNRSASAHAPATEKP